MTDYVPKPDGGFNDWQDILLTYSSENATAWGIPADVVADGKAKQTVWTVCYAKANNKQNRTAADVLDKNEARGDFEKFLRSFVQQWLAINPKVTDADRLRMGVTVKSTTRTQVPAPTTAPVGAADFSVRLQHSISYYDESSAHSNAKPEGVHGCEIFMKVDGESPKDVSELSYLGVCTASPYTVKFDSSKTGKTAYYQLRWVNTRGEYGPWSTVISAMIVG